MHSATYITFSQSGSHICFHDDWCRLPTSHDVAIQMIIRLFFNRAITDVVPSLMKELTLTNTASWRGSTAVKKWRKCMTEPNTWPMLWCGLCPWNQVGGPACHLWSRGKRNSDKTVDSWYMELRYLANIREDVFPQPPFIRHFWPVPAGFTISELYKRRFQLSSDSYCQGIVK